MWTREITKERINIKEIILTIVLFIYCINLYNIGTYIPLILIPFVFSYAYKEQISIKTFVLGFFLFIFFAIYSIILYFYQYSGYTAIIGKIIYPVLLFFLGNWLVKEDKNYNKTIKYLLTIIISFTLYGVLSTQKVISLYGNSTQARNSIGRVGLDIWSNNVVSATALNAWLAFGLSLLALLFIKDYTLEEWKKIKLFSLICFVLSAYGVIQLGNRTGVVITIVTFIITLLFSSKLSVKKIFNLILLLLLFIFGRILYKMNLFGLKNIVESSYLFGRFMDSNLTEDPRVESWKAAFIGLFENPMGGKETIMPLNSAHNMWLDVGYETGIIPFTLLIIFTIMTLNYIIKFIRKDHPPLVKGLILTLYTSFLLTFFVEPVLLGLNEYFTIFCLLMGVVYRLNQDSSSSVFK